ncbi:hypothetical protein [Ideonella livida]|uniref:Periplasmic heavy metal sensor n=1 Tax=Ideonella livida TaxID=2707176 RepID=A0A7C9PIP1_9BURK|nr:hypothetical protein [Ideonella livida]NDY92808.1 hypothetical protein [Ideonella livida]
MPAPSPWQPAAGRLRHDRLRTAGAAALSAAMVLALLSPADAGAQGFPGGMGGPGGPGGPGGDRRSAPTPREAAPAIEDLLRPDPWRLWLGVLREELADPAMAPAQAELTALLRELDDLQAQNERRVRLALRRQRAVTSPKVDVARDLTAEAEDARDWLETLQAVAQRWLALEARLDTPQRERLLARYEDCWQGRVVVPAPRR